MTAPYDVLIIGAGPAGLQLGHHLQQHGERFLILERADEPGSTFRQYPRHRMLLSINKVYTGCPEREARLRYDWNAILDDDDAPMFAKWSHDYFPDADDLQRYLADYAVRHELPIAYGTTVEQVSRDERGFVVRARGGREYRSARLVVATGVPKETTPDIEGVELCESYGTFDIDPASFEDQRVVIVGKGNSAFETAESLISTTRKIQVVGARHVKLAWASHFVGDLRAVNNNFLDTYHLKAQNNILDGEVRRVSRRSDGALDVQIWFESRQRSYTYVADRVLLCTGFRFDDSIFSDSCRPDLWRDGKYPHMTSEWESVNVPDLFFAGTLMAMRDYRKTMSSFIHGFRHNVQALDHIFGRRYRGVPWASQRPVDRQPAALAEAVVERLSVGASVFLQPGFLCELLVVPADGSTPRMLHDVPVDYVHEHVRPAGAPGDRYYMVTLEYGEAEESADPFALPRGVGVDEDFYIHPIIRCFEGHGADAVRRTHLPDDLDNDWRLDPEHVARFTSFFTDELSFRESAAPTVSGRTLALT